MAKGNVNLQDLYLNQIRRDKIPVTVFLSSGFQLKGTIKGFDNFTLIIETDNNKQQLVYKHAITTILPSKQVTFASQQNNQQNENK
ncbi:RNA chaperone Hfq [Caldicellulosiruptoraceae bacterium PP1]